MKKLIAFLTILLVVQSVTDAQLRRHAGHRVIIAPRFPKHVYCANPGRKSFSGRHRLPARSISVRQFPGIYFVSGNFFRRGAGFYYPVAAPVGFIISVMPPGYRKIHHRGVLYFEYGGNFFQKTDTGFYACPIPDGICLEVLPEEEAIPLDAVSEQFLYHGRVWRRVESGKDVFFQESGPYDG